MTSCKEAIKDIEVDGKIAAEMEEVRLCPIAMMKPLITKMDASLSTLKKCKQLRLSSNSIQKIEGLAGMDNLQILSLGRNAIKKIEGLNEICDTLEQLWLSYNQIASFSGIEKLVNLTVLYASNNRIDKWSEVERLQSLPKLRDLNLVNNPIYLKQEADGSLWRIEIIKRLDKLKVKISREGPFTEAVGWPCLTCICVCLHLALLHDRVPLRLPGA